MRTHQVAFVVILVGLSASAVTQAQLPDVYTPCQSDNDCRYGFSNMYCHKAVHDCDGVGYCDIRPQVCVAVVIPVCGCDGWVYSNSCVAAHYGVSVDHPGYCGPLQVYSAQSIKQHSGRDRALDLWSMTNPQAACVEPRSGGLTRLEIEFNKPIVGHNGLDPADVQVVVNGTPMQAIAALSIIDRTLLLTLAGIPDACRVNISFPGIERWDGDEPAVGALNINVLLGDSNNDGEVNILDVIRTRAFLSDPTAPCQQDPNLDNRVDMFDLICIRNNLGHRLPPE